MSKFVVAGDWKATVPSVLVLSSLRGCDPPFFHYCWYAMLVSTPCSCRRGEDSGFAPPLITTAAFGCPLLLNPALTLAMPLKFLSFCWWIMLWWWELLMPLMWPPLCFSTFIVINWFWVLEPGAPDWLSSRRLVILGKRPCGLAFIWNYLWFKRFTLAPINC